VNMIGLGGDCGRVDRDGGWIGHHLESKGTGRGVEAEGRYQLKLCCC
jgi:hypothetical protein